MYESQRRSSQPRKGTLSKPRKQTVSKFQNFIKGAVFDSKQTSRQDINALPFQRRISAVMNRTSIGNFSLVNRTSSKFQQQQFSMLQELRNKISQSSTFQTETDRIEQMIDDEIYYSHNLAFIIKIQRMFRGKRVRKMIVKQKKNFRHRKNVLLELFNTEKGYCNDLSLICSYIEGRFKDSNLVKQEQMIVLFGHIEEILQFNLQFFSELQKVKLDAFDSLKQFGQILDQNANGFKVYYNFCKNFNKGDVLYKELKKTNEKFNLFTKSLKNDKILRCLGYEGFMIKPIQRLPKYNLLLNDFIQHTEENNYFLSLYQSAYCKFLAVCEENNKNICTLAQSIKLVELQRYYGDPFKLTILENNRNFIQENKITFLIDNQEKDALVYVLTDLILLCEPDERIETGYKLFKHLILTDKSYCQSIPNKRYYNNLTKLIGKNASLTIVSETPAIKQQLIGFIQSVIYQLKQRTQKVQNVCNHQIEVSVLGTEERGGGVNQYTLYVIQVSIGRVTSKLFLRYSELKFLSDTLQKEHSEFHLPPFTPTSWLQNKSENKVIEQRKVEIEDFILALLVNDEFFNRDQAFKNKIFVQLGLDTNFYDQPDLLEDFEKNQKSRVSDDRSPHPGSRLQSFSSTSTTSDEKISYNQLSRISFCGKPDLNSASTSMISSVSKSLIQSQSIPMIDVTIVFHDDKKLELKVPNWYHCGDLICLISDKIGLKDYCDFKLFETDESLEKLTPILDDEIIEQVIKRDNRGTMDKLFSFFKKKLLLFRKYLFFPSQNEETSDILQGDNIRQGLITAQIFFDIKRNTFTFQLKDYSLFVALYMIMKQMSFVYTNTFQYEWIKKVVPDDILKKQAKGQWIQETLGLFNLMQIDISQICFLNQKISQFEGETYDPLQDNQLNSYQTQLLKREQSKQISQDLEKSIFSNQVNPMRRDGKLLQQLNQTEDTKEKFQKLQENKTLVSTTLFLNLVNKHLFYGVALFPVKQTSKDFEKLFKYIKTRTQKQIRIQGLSIGVSFQGIQLVDELRRIIYLCLQYADIDDLDAHSDQFNLYVEDRSIEFNFQTLQGYQIVSLIHEYEYLKVELETIQEELTRENQ